MKPGDLVKFRSQKGGPCGVVIRLETLEKAPHPSQPSRETAVIHWACPYTPQGNYQTILLEVINENR